MCVENETRKALFYGANWALWWCLCDVEGGGPAYYTKRSHRAVPHYMTSYKGTTRAHSPLKYTDG